jgi:uncharacterized protein (TIGR02996 family)
MTDDAFLAAILATPHDAAPRLIYSDWLDEQGEHDRAELIRVCEGMRGLPNFSDGYWRLKTRRDVLRPRCPPDWLARTGYDGSRYDPLYRDGIPPDWKGRWRLIREYAERWHGLAMGDVGGRLEEVRAEEQRLGPLPPSVREYVAYAHDVAPEFGFGTVHRDEYTMRRMEGHEALSLMIIGEGNVQWAVRDADFALEDPPVHVYYWAEGDDTRFVPAPVSPAYPTLTDFVLGFVTAYQPDAGSFAIRMGDPHWVRGELEAAFPVRLARERGTLYEGDGVIASLYADHQPGTTLSVCVHRSMTWERVPFFLWHYAAYAHTRGGLFLSEEDRQVSRGHGMDLPPAPPPLQTRPPSEPLGYRVHGGPPF